MKELKQKQGITLVALVITIIVLLILAGVVLNLTFHENSIIRQAQGAGNKYQEEAIKEELRLKIIDLQAKIYQEKTRKATLEDLKEELALEQISMEIIEGDMIYGKIRYKGIVYYLDQELNEIPPQENTGIAQQWLLTIHEQSDKTLEEIFEDEALLERLMNTEASIDFMLQHKKELMTPVIENQNAMKKTANSEKAMEKIVQDEEWVMAILNSPNALQCLDESNPTLVPAMRDYTIPEGEVIYSSYYASNANHYPWRAFSGSFDPIYDWESNTNGFPQYIGYKFTKPVWLYKCEILNSNNSAPTEMVLQKSEDGVKWTNVFDDFTYVSTDQKTTSVIRSKENLGKAMYWRLYITKAQNQNYVDIRQIQFYTK